MKRLFLLALLCLLILILQTTVRYWPTPSLRLDLFLLLVIYIGSRETLLRGGLVILLIAFAVETWASPVPGGLALATLSIFFLMRLLHRSLLLEGLLARSLWVFFLVVVEKTIEFFLISRSGTFFPLRTLAELGMLHATASLAFFPLLNGLEARLHEAR